MAGALPDLFGRTRRVEFPKVTRRDQLRLQSTAVALVTSRMSAAVVFATVATATTQTKQELGINEGSPFRGSRP